MTLLANLTAENWIAIAGVAVAAAGVLVAIWSVRRGGASNAARNSGDVTASGGGIAIRAGHNAKVVQGAPPRGEDDPA